MTKLPYLRPNHPTMTIFEQNKEFYNQPIRLDKEQKKDPLQVINDFFGDIHLWECKEELAGWLEVALTTSNSQFDVAGQRKPIFTFAEKLEELVEAAYILQLKKK